MTSSEEITREWPYTKALYNYADYFVDFAADSISKHARRPLPTDMVAMKEAKPFGASNGPNCVAARHCRVDLFEAEFVSAANTVGRKMVVEMQQQQKDAAASGTALPAEHAAILALASKASMKRKLFKYEAYDAYLCVQDVGTFGVGLQIRTRFQPSCPNVHQDCATFKVQKFVAASNQFVVCFTGQRFLEATGNAVLAYWKERGGDSVEPVDEFDELAADVEKEDHEEEEDKKMKQVEVIGVDKQTWFKFGDGGMNATPHDELSSLLKKMLKEVSTSHSS